MKNIITLIVCIVICSSLKAINSYNIFKIKPLNTHYYGIDVAQFNYYLGTGKKGFNFGTCYSYKPYHFLSLNSSLTYNSIHGNDGYSNLTEYNSKGACLKLGTDASVRLSKNRKTRAFLGFQYGILNFKESGIFTMPNYWGTYINNYQTKAKFYGVTEVIFGFQFSINKIFIKTQIYSMFNSYNPKISYHDEVIEGYQTPFVPGYGFRRGGLNLIVGF